MRKRGLDCAPGKLGKHVYLSPCLSYASGRGSRRACSRPDARMSPQKTAQAPTGRSTEAAGPPPALLLPPTRYLTNMFTGLVEIIGSKRPVMPPIDRPRPTDDDDKPSLPWRRLTRLQAEAAEPRSPLAMRKTYSAMQIWGIASV